MIANNSNSNNNRAWTPYAVALNPSALRRYSVAFYAPGGDGGIYLGHMESAYFLYRSAVQLARELNLAYLRGQDSLGSQGGR